MKKLSFLIALVILVSYAAIAGGPGTSTANILKIPQSAAPAGMGNAYTGLATDINALAFNPAGLYYAKGKEFLFTHNDLYTDIKYEYFAYTFPVNSIGSNIGMSLGYVDYGNMDKYTIANPFNPTNEGQFDANDLLFTIGTGLRLNDMTSMGFNFKFIKQDIDNVDASGFAFDIGLLRKQNENLSYGIVLKNFGSKLRFDKDKNRLPTAIAAGVGYKYLLGTGELTLALDIEKPNDNDVLVSVGGDYKFNNIFSLRLGYNSVNDADNGFTGGFGVAYNSFRVDYSYAPFGDLGDAHRFSIGYKF